ncbi:MAG: superoxide dismutase [Candidatus Dependentiae bacterium]|nr:superoxide dismutase [Candidatus Dependentiae bacterium]
MSVVLPPLPYLYNALEPYLDARTVEIHYTKHHRGYVDKVNKAFEKHPELVAKPLEELLTHLELVPEDIRAAVRNQGGGAYIHTFFWRCMAPAGAALREPKGALKSALEKSFGSVADFKKKFEEVALSHFGSGWAWLVIDKTGALSVISTPNHDIPQRQGLTPLLVLDVWEHAYYLKFQNRRNEFVAAWWHVVNWSHVEELFDHTHQSSEAI